MLQKRNLTCAGVLLRMQMDNCMRTYAVFIAEDRSAVIDCIINGSRVKDYKDTKGNKMSDGYLKNELSKQDPVFAQVYDQASGYFTFRIRRSIKCSNHAMITQYVSMLGQICWSGITLF